MVFLAFFQKKQGKEGQGRGREGGKMKEKGWEERGPKAHPKNSFRCSLVAFPYLEVANTQWVVLAILDHYDLSSIRCDPNSQRNLLRTENPLTSGESNRPLTPILLQKYRDTPPISIVILLQKYALLLTESSIYTPPICITIRLPFVSRYFCRSIRVRGRWNTPPK